MRLHAAILLSFLLLAAGAPVAGAASTVAPPGQSAIDEYLETIPSDGGNTAAGGSAGKPKPAPGVRSTAVVPARTLRALRAGGADGRAAASLAVAAAPPAAANKRGTSAGAPGVIAVKGEQASGGALSTLTSAVTGTKGGGSGALLPVLLILIVLAGVGVGVLRRRGHGAPA